MPISTTREAPRAARKERTPEEIDAVVRDAMAIAEHCSSLPVLDDRSLEEMLYDERGLPA